MKKLTVLILSLALALSVAFAADAQEWENGVLYEGDVAIKCDPEVVGEELIIRHGTREIESYAFENCAGIKRVDLPMTIKKIGVGAFQGTDYLINVANYENGMLINEGCIINVAPDMKVIDIPNNVQTIAGGAFIGSRAEEINIPNTVYEIPATAFSGLDKEVVVDYDGTLAEFIRYADFDYDCINLYTNNITWHIVTLVILALFLVGTIVYLAIREIKIDEGEWEDD